MTRVRKLSSPRGWPFAIADVTVKPVLAALTSRTWIDGHKIPHTGGVLVVSNHISHLDPLTTAHFVYDHGRVPRYLAKSSLFKNPVMGAFLKAAGQVPVERMTAGAAEAFTAAIAAINAGECVVVYPEGTLTRDPHLWPMTAKTGAARLALETRCPVIPIAQWGVQEVLPPYAPFPRLFPRGHVTVQAGDPIDLSDLYDLPRNAEVIAQTNERIMNTLTAMVAALRGEEPPAERFDARKAGLRMTGNPNKPEKRKP
jgi:1-acyl-sn-glycerol-3-phosphate acyltransferase